MSCSEGLGTGANQECLGPFKPGEGMGVAEGELRAEETADWVADAEGKKLRRVEDRVRAGPAGR